MRVYFLDDYSVHWLLEIRRKLLAQGYFLVIIGGGVTGVVQGNDMHSHSEAKRIYRQLEMELLIRKLKDQPSKIPSSRDKQMSQSLRVWKETLENVDASLAMKNNFVTNNFDGSKTI